MILDAGVLIAIDRGEWSIGGLPHGSDRLDVDFHTSEAVIAQVWRAGARQAILAAFLRTVECHPLDDGRAVGQLLRDSGTSDVVDAHLGLLAQRLDDDILTGDVDDLRQVVAVLAHPVNVLPWPPRR